MTVNECRHVFRTFLGIPPDKNDKPVCGAELPADWQVGPDAPTCGTCDEIMAAEAASKTN